jgi:hypothetical protein
MTKPHGRRDRPSNSSTPLTTPVASLADLEPASVTPSPTLKPATLERSPLTRAENRSLHTFGTLAVEVWPLHDVQAYTGHADIQTTMIHVHHQSKAAAADKLSQLVAPAAPGGSDIRDAPVLV